MIVFTIPTTLSSGASLPTRATKYSAGADLRALGDYIIQPGKRLLISTGLKMTICKGHYGRIASRSGLAMKGIDVAAGTIDADYRGEIKVLLCNNSVDPFEIKSGDRIAQLIIEKCYLVEFEQCESLENTKRGEGGFGSTGKN